MSIRSRRIPRMIRASVGLALVAHIASASGLRAENYPRPSLPRATQAWGTVTGKQRLCEAGDRILIPGNGPMQVKGIEKRDPETWTIRDKGQLKTWKVSQQGEKLKVEISGEATEYKRLDTIPEDCVFKLLAVGPAHAVPRERVLAISQEVYDRMRRDQEEIKATKDGNLLPASDTMIQNKEYLKSLIQELGWIDIHRFGEETSGNAIVMAKHSEDLSFMVGILPFVEKDLKSPHEDNVMLAILYDGLQIDLGRKQHYGTQLGTDPEGHPMVLQLEDVTKVEQFRKEIGLPPLAEYLKLASEGLFSGKPIRMPRADE